VTSAAKPLPSNLAAAHATILAERAARLAAEAERVKLLLALARRTKYDQSFERGHRLSAPKPGICFGR
jgi:transposase